MEKQNKRMDFKTIFSDLSVEETDVLLQGWTEPALSPAVMRRIRKDTREKAGLAAHRSRRVFKWLAPLAACLILAVTLFSIPSVAKAITNWFYQSFDIGRYLDTPAEDREKNEDVEKVITTPEPGAASIVIRYLDETEYYEGADEWRIKKGVEKFNRKDYAWVEDLHPELSEVLYDGTNLIFNTMFHVSPMKFIGGYSSEKIEGAERFDLYPVDIYTSFDGESWEQRENGDSGLLVPRMFYDQITRKYDVEAVKAATVSYVQASIEGQTVPLFPSGQVFVKVVYWLFDGRVDDMSPIGLVAEIEQTFSLDTTEGNAMLKPSGQVTSALSGAVISTSHTHERSGESYLMNTELDLSGVTVTFTPIVRATGISLTVHYDCDPEIRPRLGYGWPHGEGLYYTLYVNGEMGSEVAHAGSSGGADDGYQLEIPLTPSELANVTSIELVPFFRYVQSYDYEPEYVYKTDETGRRTLDHAATEAHATSMPLNEKVPFYSGELFYGTIELHGLRIALPIP